MSLRYATISDFDNVWKSTRIDPSPDFGIWAPKTPTALSGYYFLGHVANLTYDPPTSVRIYTPGQPGDLLPATPANTKFTKIWDDHGYSGSEKTAIWRLDPTVPNYVSLGYLASSGNFDKPDLTKMNLAYVYHTLVMPATKDDFENLTSGFTGVPNVWRMKTDLYDTFVCGIHYMPAPLYKLSPVALLEVDRNGR